MTVQTRSFTREELSRYDRRMDRPAFVACRGLVYDVTGSLLWQGGKHQATHFAGCDHTRSCVGTPHGAELLDRFPVVGMLVGENR